MGIEKCLWRLNTSAWEIIWENRWKKWHSWEASSCSKQHFMLHKLWLTMSLTFIRAFYRSKLARTTRKFLFLFSLRYFTFKWCLLPYLKDLLCVVSNFQHFKLLLHLVNYESWSKKKMNERELRGRKLKTKFKHVWNFRMKFFLSMNSWNFSFFGVFQCKVDFVIEIFSPKNCW